MDSIPFEDHKEILNAAESRIEELEAENKRLRERAKKVCDVTKKSRSVSMQMPFALVVAIDQLEKALKGEDK